MAIHSLTPNFNAMMKRLNPSVSYVLQAASQQRFIRNLLEGSDCGLNLKTFLQGSYGQQTAIYSINDVDIVALFTELSQGGPATAGVSYYSRDKLFDLIAKTLTKDHRYREKVYYGPTSMCVKVDLGIKVEILPVVMKSGNVDADLEPFRLFRPSSNTWSDGYARYHQYWLSDKNNAARTGGSFIPMIKLMKHLRSAFSLSAVSFHIECLLYHLPDWLYLGSPADYITAILEFIASVDAATWYGTKVMTPCRERDIFTDSEWQWDSWRVFHEYALTWARTARAAVEAPSREYAIKFWQLLFGDEYFPTDA